MVSTQEARALLVLTSLLFFNSAHALEIVMTCEPWRGDKLVQVKYKENITQKAQVYYWSAGEWKVSSCAKPYMEKPDDDGFFIENARVIKKNFAECDVRKYEKFPTIKADRITASLDFQIGQMVKKEWLNGAQWDKSPSKTIVRKCAFKQ